jgi:hypothetical protein
VVQLLVIVQEANGKSFLELVFFLESTNMKNEPVNIWYSLLYQNKFWSGSARQKPSVLSAPFFAFGLKRIVANRHEKRRNSRLFFSHKTKKSPLPFWQGTFLKKQRQKKQLKRVLKMNRKCITFVHICNTRPPTNAGITIF